MRKSGWRPRDSFSSGANTSRCHGEGTSHLSEPAWARAKANSPPSLRVRNARLHDCRYSFPESAMERPLGLRCTRRTPRCFSSRVNALLTVEVGSCTSFAAAVGVPAPCDRNKRADIVEIEVSHALRLPFSAVRAAMEQTRTRFPLLAGAETQLIAVLSLPQYCVAAILPCAIACVKVFRRSL
jgi:hypothetical protein